MNFNFEISRADYMKINITAYQSTNMHVSTIFSKDLKDALKMVFHKQHIS